MSEGIKRLLDGNKRWVEDINNSDPSFFSKLEEGQTPEFLWIGCSDSRVPASDITNTLPGAIFVHRNIANNIIHTDSNSLSVVYYAVKVLKVKHIIVCGHYGCGGVAAAMGNDSVNFLDNWLLHIKDTYAKHSKELDSIPKREERLNRFVELNVIEQVENLSKVYFIQEEWAKGEYPYIHGWVYNLGDGKIRDLGVSVNNESHLKGIYQHNVPEEN